MTPVSAQPEAPETDGSAATRAFYDTLLKTEYASPVSLAGFQEDTLKRYLEFASRLVPYHRDRLDFLVDGTGSIDLKRWLDVPVMTKSDLGDNLEDLWPDAIPEAHGRIETGSTSGTTGHPLILRKSRLHGTALTCVFYRMGAAFGLDWTRDLVVIRAFDSAWRGPRSPISSSDIWGPRWLTAEGGGHRHRMSIHSTVGEQLEFLRATAPAYLNTSACNAMALAAEIARTGDEPPRIVAILTVGEHVSDDLRTECRTHLKCEIIDAFSTAECGTLATQCAEGSGYHLHPEVNVLEVLKPDGTPCGPGEMGLVTVTPLYNYAMPLVRYQSDDLVTVGGICECGRTAPVLSTLHGREEHHFIAPDGSYMKPVPIAERMRELAGFRRWQLVQTAKHEAELRFMDDASAPPVMTDALAVYLQSLLPAGFNVAVKRVRALGPSAGGKFAAVTREWARR